MTGCGGECSQGRRACKCRAGLPPVTVHAVEWAYQSQPFPRVARWVDAHPNLTTALLVLAMVGVFLVSAWLDGAP